MFLLHIFLFIKPCFSNHWIHLMADNWSFSSHLLIQSTVTCHERGSTLVYLWPCLAYKAFFSSIFIRNCSISFISSFRYWRPCKTQFKNGLQNKCMCPQMLYDSSRVTSATVTTKVHHNGFLLRYWNFTQIYILCWSLWSDEQGLAFNSVSIPEYFSSFSPT